MVNNLMNWEKLCVMKMMFYNANIHKFTDKDVPEFLVAICSSLNMHREEMLAANNLPLEQAYININALNETSKSEIVLIIHSHINTAGKGNVQVFKLFFLICELLGVNSEL